MLHALSIARFAAGVIATLPSFRADMPPAPPQDYEVQSANGQYVAKVTVAPPKTTIYAVREGVEAPAWSMDGFYRYVFLAEDGRHLVIANDGYNCIPTNFSPDMLILRFVEHGRAVHDVRLRDLMPDLSKLVRTVSHYCWGAFRETFSGINNRGEFVVKTVDYRVLYFDVKTGQLLKTEGRFVEWLGEALRFRRDLDAAAVSCLLGVIIGIVFRGRRFWFALAISVTLNTALALFPFWAEAKVVAVSFWEVIASKDFFILTLGIFYLLPSTFLVIVANLLWRRYRPLGT